MDLENLRLVNCVTFFLIASTLAWRHMWNRANRNLTDRLRSATCVLVFAFLAYASYVAWREELPALWYLRFVTVALLLYLTALWAPWRWRLSFLFRR